jgi:LuxR family maltose regulon positive regulatory protein
MKSGEETAKRRLSTKDQQSADDQSATVPPAKVTPPQLSNVFQRTRLFALLDEAGGRAPVTWIEGVPGAGKTTLVASYLDVRRLHRLWYQCDAGDADAATLFHYLGIAAAHIDPSVSAQLPRFTAEHRCDPLAFARRYFEELARWLSPDTALVFDNFEDAGATDELHAVLCAGLGRLPAGCRVFILSRAAPPAVCAHMLAQQRLVCLPCPSLRLTLDEARGIAALRGMDDESALARDGRQD